MRMDMIPNIEDVVEFFSEPKNKEMFKQISILSIPTLTVAKLDAKVEKQSAILFFFAMLRGWVKFEIKTDPLVLPSIYDDYNPPGLVFDIYETFVGKLKANWKSNRLYLPEKVQIVKSKRSLSIPAEKGTLWVFTIKFKGKGFSIKSKLLKQLPPNATLVGKLNKKEKEDNSSWDNFWCGAGIYSTGDTRYDEDPRPARGERSIGII
jgi:hypothetical protein